jgi:hypothetical protein
MSEARLVRRIPAPAPAQDPTAPPRLVRRVAPVATPAAQPAPDLRPDPGWYWVRLRVQGYTDPQTTPARLTASGVWDLAIGGWTVCDGPDIEILARIPPPPGGA